jgi:hypothetical protein
MLPSWLAFVFGLLEKRVDKSGDREQGTGVATEFKRSMYADFV